MKGMTLSLVLLSLLINAAAVSDAYTNHTVGGDAGWFFNSTTNTTSTDFNAWASNQTFSLGDYLIFNTNANQTLIQTYNRTTYASCSIDDSLDTDTFQYDGGNYQLGDVPSIPVPLTIEGIQYYFSAAEDGEQCQHGMAFQINVTHGLGLPPSLNQPPPPPYVEPPISADGRQGLSPPVEVGTNNINHGMRTAGASFSCLVLLMVVFLSYFLG